MFNPFSKLVNRIKSRRYGRFMLPLAAFVVGAAVMAVEITAARLLAPFFGASIFVWTSLILTVLLALSLGYWLGGKLAEKETDRQALAYLMIGAAVLQGAGARFSGLAASNLVGLVSGWQQASLALMAGSFLSAIFILAVPMVALGSMSPLIIKFWAEESGVAKASSRYLLLSTLGGAVGTLMPTLVLVPAIGTQRTIGLFALLLFVCGFVILKSSYRRKIWPLALLFLALTLAGNGPQSPHLLARAESPYQLIRVLKGDDGKNYLFFNEGSGVQSISSTPGERTEMYYDYFGLLPLLRPNASLDHDVAIIGLAGGATVFGYLEMSPDISPKFIGVEIDPTVVEIAREHFGLSDMPVDVQVEDGRMFLDQTDKKFQTIILDAYSTQLYIPPHMVTEEFFQLTSDKLVPGGIAVMNLNATSTNTLLFQTLTNTAAKIFSHVIAIPQSDSWNWLVLMSYEPINPKTVLGYLPVGYEDIASDILLTETIQHNPTKPVFTDDWAPVEFMTEAMILREAWAIL